MRVVAEGNQLKVFLNDGLIITASDSRLSQGNLTIGTGPNVAVQFDDFKVTGLNSTAIPAPETASSTVSKPNLLSTPDIPVYDTFDDPQPDLSKWSEPAWGNPIIFRPTQKNGNLILELNINPQGSWRDWAIRDERLISDLAALVSLENTDDGRIGISIRGKSYRYELFINSFDSVTIVNASDSNWKESKIVDLPDGCCNTQYLISAKANGSQISFFLDGKLLVSYPVDSYPDYGGIQILGATHTIAHVDTVWVKFNP